MDIRDFEPADQVSVRSIIQAGLRERWGAAYDPVFNTDTDDLVANYTTHGNQMVVATNDHGLICGCGALVEQEPGVGRILRMSVSAAHRRQGIARSIVQELTARARMAGHRVLRVNTDTPWIEAVELYRSCGFAEVRTSETDTYFELDLRDARLTFDQVPELYTAARPGYPDALFERLFESLPAEPTIVEVGPGTGQATESLLRRGAEVTAVEIGSALAGELERRFGSSDRLRIVNDAFEQVDLPRFHFDAVVSATAYHWVTATSQVTRPHELLRPGGKIAIIDLIQVGSPSDQGYFDRVQPIYAAFGNDRHDWSPPSYETAMPAMAGRLKDSVEFGDVAITRIPWDQTYTSTEYRDLLLTYSGTRMMRSDQRDDMVGQLVAVIDDEFGGTITRPLVATLTTATTRRLSDETMA